MKSTANKALLVAALVTFFAPVMAADKAAAAPAAETKKVTVVTVTEAPAAPSYTTRATTAAKDAFASAKSFYVEGSVTSRVFKAVSSLALAKVAYDLVSNCCAAEEAEAN